MTASVTPLKPNDEGEEESAGSGAIKLQALRDSLKELENAHAVLAGAKAAWRDTVAAVAEKSGVDPSVIRAFIAARMAERAEQAEKKAERARQLALVFEEVGT